MRWKLLCFVAVVLVAFYYVFSFHREKYDSAISLVIEGTKTFKKKVGLTDAEELEEPTTSSGIISLSDSTITPPAHNNGSTTQNSVVTHGVAVTNASEEVHLLGHTDQDIWRKHRLSTCYEIDRMSWSQYGRNIKSVGLSYFTKYDPNFKFTYCSIPKVASTNWKRTLIVLSYDRDTRDNMTRADVNALKNVHNNPAVKALSKVGGSPLRSPYAEYYKFVFFRHPFTRMVSAWRNKFQLNHGRINKYFYKNYGINIIRITRGNEGVKQFIKVQSPLVSFQEFVVGIKNRIIDRHWMPQTEICVPCKVNYDFVGFFEHLDNDTSYILDQIGVLDEIVKPDKISEAGQHKSTTEVTKELFATLSEEDVGMLYEYYKKDFLMYGYDRDVNSETFPYPSIGQIT